MEILDHQAREAIASLPLGRQTGIMFHAHNVVRYTDAVGENLDLTPPAYEGLLLRVVMSDLVSNTVEELKMPPRIPSVGGILAIEYDMPTRESIEEDLKRRDNLPAAVVAPATRALASFVYMHSMVCYGQPDWNTSGQGQVLNGAMRDYRFRILEPMVAFSGQVNNVIELLERELRHESGGN